MVNNLGPCFLGSVVSMRHLFMTLMCQCLCNRLDRVTAQFHSTHTAVPLPCKQLNCLAFNTALLKPAFSLLLVLSVCPDGIFHFA